MIDKKLNKACEYALNNIINEYYCDKDSFEEIRFSEVFEKKMSRLLRIHRKPYYRLINSVGKRIAILLIVLSTFLLAVNAQAIYRMVVNFKITDRITNSEVVYDIPEDYNYPNKIDEVRIPSYVPNGFRETERIVVPNGMVRIMYENDSGQYYAFLQMILSVNQVINTEGVDAEIFEVKGKKVFYCENLGEAIVTWTDGEYAYSINGEITKKEVLNIVKSDYE